MIYRWWNTSFIAASIVTIIRIYLGFHFFLSGWNKIMSENFHAGDFIREAIENPVIGRDGTPIYGMYYRFLEGIALPNVEVFNFIVQWGEFLVGLGLIFGFLTPFAAFFGAVMNFSFLMAGSIASNPLYILMEFLILMAGANAGRLGMDYFARPYYEQLAEKLKEVKTIFKT